MMGTLKRKVTCLVIGVGLYFELQVVFCRFANIFNIENTTMIKIDEETKRPIEELKSKKAQNYENSLY
jgi:hypothetical protein